MTGSFGGDTTGFGGHTTGEMTGTGDMNDSMARTSKAGFSRMGSTSRLTRMGSTSSMGDHMTSTGTGFHGASSSPPGRKSKKKSLIKRGTTQNLDVTAGIDVASPMLQTGNIDGQVGGGKQDDPSRNTKGAVGHSRIMELGKQVGKQGGRQLVLS